MPTLTRRGGKKNRKHGRNELFCKAYRTRGQREKNKARKLRKHLLRFGDDKVAQGALERLARRVRLPLDSTAPLV